MSILTTREERREKRREKRVARQEARRQAFEVLRGIIHRNRRFVAAAGCLYIAGELTETQVYLAPSVLAACLFYIGWAIWKLESRKDGTF